MLRDFTPRLYQQTILGTAAYKNTLVVLPTGLGKTAIAFLLAAQRLHQYPQSKILMLSPTKPLCEQHVQTFQKHLDLPAERIVLFTGEISPEKRAEMWKNATITISTPQCVTGDTLIYTKEDGVISIKDFVESFCLEEKKYGDKSGFHADIKAEILGLNNNAVALVKAIKCWKLPCEKLIYLKTEMHNEIRCTPEHPLLAIDDFGTMHWEKAENIPKDSYVAMAAGSDIPPRTTELYSFFKESTLRLADPELIQRLYRELKKKKITDRRYYNYQKKSMPLKQFFGDAEKVNLPFPEELKITNSTGRSEVLTLPQKLSPSLAYIIGAMLADGHLGNRSKEHGNEVVYSELFYPTILQRFSEKVYSVFNVKPSRDDPSKGLIYYSTALATVLNSLGVPFGKKAKILRVPSIIFNSDPETILSFLSGVLNADGDFHKHMIRVCSVSKKFIQDLRWLLLKLNITSSFETRPAKQSKIFNRKIHGSESYHLIMSGAESIHKIIFGKDIDIIKSRHLRKEISRIKKRGTRSKDILPVKKALKTTYEEHRKNGGLTINEFRVAYSKGYVSKDYLKEKLPLLKSKKAQELLTLLDLPLRWVKIKDKKELNSPDFVYDLTVENEHNFVTNLLISHNTVENDVINRRIKLEDVSLIIFDEAHHATKDYAYVWLAQQYEKAARYSRILALTASPGSDLETVQQVCQNLHIERVEVRTEKDPDVKPYIQKMHFQWEEVQFPAEFKKTQTHLKDCWKSKLLEAQKYGYCSGTDLRKGEILQLQADLHQKIAQGERDFELLRSVSLLAEALKVEHALELLESQGIAQLHSYFVKIQQEALTSKVKATKNLALDANFKAAALLTAELIQQGIEHPKLPRLLGLVEEVLLQNTTAKMIIFTQFRNSAEEVIKKLHGKNISANIFVGQAKKNGLGFSQKQQKEILDRFRAGEFNVLVATSVAEEGLDIPRVDKVIFYEPVPSAIRAIQRRGRTGRLEKGEVTMLITAGTRDQAYRWSAHHKEKRMYRNLEKLRTELSLLSLDKKEATLSQFIPPEQLVAIVADHREKDNKVLKELLDLGVSVNTTQLQTADYLLSGNVAVELKKVPDFVNSIIDGRLLSQARELKQFEKAVIIIEGEEDIYSIRQIHPNAIRGMLATLVLDFGIPVLYTKNPRDTAAVLAVMAKREQDKSRDFSYHERKPRTMAEQQEFIVSSLSGIGVQTARKLLEHFESIKTIVNASREELLKLEGVGEKTADKLMSLFEEKYKK